MPTLVPLHLDCCNHIGLCPITGAHPSAMTRGGRHTKRGRGRRPGRPRPPRPPKPQETHQQFKVQALKKLQEVEDDALGFLNFTHDAIQWRRNQQVWIRLQIKGFAFRRITGVTP